MRNFLVAVIVVLLAAWSIHYYETNKGFTPWMVGAELDKFCRDHEHPPDGSPNFWTQGNWVDAVEGRWHNGVPQYRVRYGKVPVKRGDYSWWYWYFNQDQQAFASHVHEFADKGFTLIDPNSFKRPDDTRRYQGVWHKIQTKEQHDAELAEQAARNSPPPEVPHPALPLPSAPEVAAFQVIENGDHVRFEDLNRSMIGHACSVYLKKKVVWGGDLINRLPNGMYVTRDSVQIVNGTLSDFITGALSISNKSTTIPIVRPQIDYVIVAK